MTREGGVRVVPTDAARGARPVDLVFRTVGERTSDLALRLAIEHIGPRQVHVIEHVRPFSRAVELMLDIDHGDAGHVVHMDADCLILEDLRPFLDANRLPYVDCYVHDRFRGRIHCGVHVTRTDVLRAMADVQLPEGDIAYVLRPESRLRNAALAELGAEKQFKSFRILHDHLQRWSDVFAKYALRELRSRSPFQRQRLDAAVASWGGDIDLDVARAAIAHAASAVPPGSDARLIDAYVRALPSIAEQELARLGLGEQPPLTVAEVEGIAATVPVRAARPKVFGIGLSRTGARTLAAALHVLGLDVVHAPSEAESLDAIRRGDGAFPLLAHFDGITGLATLPCLEELLRDHPGARFVLTDREEGAWLTSCEAHWNDRAVATPEASRVLRQQVYGMESFDRTRFATVRRTHRERVERLFSPRREQLLVVDVTAGSRWQELAAFVGEPVPDHPWPHKGRPIDPRRLAAMEPDD